jgi:hypothetical protein
MRKAMIRSGIFDPITQEQKPRAGQAAGKQKEKKIILQGQVRRRLGPIKLPNVLLSRSLVQVPEKSQVPYSDGEATPENGNVATVTKTIKHVTRPTIERLKQYNNVEAPVDQRLSLDKVEARMSIDESWTDELFGPPESYTASES